MLTRSRLIADSSSFAGEPPTTPVPDGVPEALRFSLLADLETELIRDANLATEDRYVSSTPVQLQIDTRDFVLSGANIESPCYVSVISSDMPAPWNRDRDVDITNLTQLNQNYREGKLAVAFYSDRPRRGRVSWNPTGLETLTVWYDKSPQVDPSVDQATMTITDSYLPLLKLLLAAQMLELMKQPIGNMLKSRIQRGLSQWEKYTKRNRQSGTVEKSSWAPTRRTGRGPWNSEFPIR